MIKPNRYLGRPLKARAGGTRPGGPGSISCVTETPPSEPVTVIRRWRALAVCLVAQFITLLDFSIVVVALPSIGIGTGAGASQLQWVVSGYALAFATVPIIGGRLGDDRGRRLMLLIGIGGFVTTSAVIGLAPNPGVLIAGRVLQGSALRPVRSSAGC
jgi:MFS family permease